MLALPLKEETESNLESRGVALRQSHVDSRLSSRFAFWFNGARPPPEQLRRVIAHLVEAGSLALQHFILSDERLSRWGRSNRGAAAMVDVYGTVYAATRSFRELLGAEFGDPNFAQLPFQLPDDPSEERGAFAQASLRFRLVPTDARRFLLYARKAQVLDGLSPREQEIARALGAGKTLKSVARQYGIATSTVANHASRVYRKLGIYRREELFDLIRSLSGRTGKPGSGTA
jgi:DNA-binding CsgD family transcriptional regulator